MKYLIIRYLLVSIALLTACKKVLDTKSELYIDQSLSIVDKRSAQAALVGAYNVLSQNTYQGNTFRYITNLLSDNIKWVGNTPTNREFDVYSVFTTNTRVQELWTAIYKTINIANNLIDKVPAVNDVTFDQSERNKQRGEAYFLRALCYFDLVRLWRNVPVVTQPTKTASDNKGITNSTGEEVYQFIENDLDSAEVLLPATINRNRANQYTAKALKARMYLYRENWKKAEEYANLIINDSADFKLTKPYSQFYTAKNSTESIFEIDYTINNKNSYASNWFQNPTTGGKKEFLPTDEFVNLLKDPNIGGARSALMFTVSGVTYGNMNFKIATGEDQSYVLRLGEMYLIRAEAKAEQLKLEEGLKDLNVIRARANIPSIPVVGSKEELIDKILLERRVELGYESHRWFDLIRKGKAQQVLGISDANKLLLPLPRQEVLIANLTQNKGY
ncbi:MULTISPECIES: RagB/SusD family nutrient uptake outer membrane protein [Niastella]|uniref:RagB/SusD family nutrient uptake outer membrane protein n=1 Tax=Niastella soli TaxID=2821487 RepID=A0ABS3Z3Q0_9BACT|nr:RagB/SusD family nutrient uptake outer membrane protein [Niastella soli]MBO9204265.1 RagB/SusD family nutrient uptake outer membrane protein [Niastella soli]